MATYIPSLGVLVGAPAIANVAENRMQTLYQRLAAIGLSRPYIRKTILPSWWDDEAAESPTGYSEALLLLSRHLGLEISDLRDGTADVRPDEGTAFKLKTSVGTTADDVTVARSIATQVAQFAALGTAIPYQPVGSAFAIREGILDRGHPWVSLDALLDYSWEHGLPVLHLSGFPRGIKRMHGLAAMLSQRPVAVLCQNHKFSAWQLFILAHELGHIACGHLSAGQHILVDQDVDQDSADTEESEANRFAMELLSGNPDLRVQATSRWPNAQELADAGLRRGKELQIDPGHFVLNYAHSMGKAFYAVANGALKSIEPDARAPELIRRKMAANLDWSKLPGDSSEFLMRITQAEATLAS